MSEREDDDRVAEAPRSGEQPAGLFERVRALFGLTPASVRDDIEEAIDDSVGAEFTPQERAILKNVLALHDVKVADVMVPRADIIALTLDTPLRDVLDLFRTAGHSRLPVYGETLDDPRGMIHIRDFVVFLASDPRFGLSAGPALTANDPSARLSLDTPLSAAHILRPVLYAPPSMPALDLLLRMQASRTHMALVIDEYGGTDGLVSIEDVVESIVGDIEDEHDEAEAPELQASPDGAFIVDARAPLDDVSQSMGFDFASLADAEEVDTIGGLVTASAGRVPSRGEILRGPGEFEYEVLDADPRRIKRLKIWPLAARGAKAPPAPTGRSCAEKPVAGTVAPDGGRVWTTIWRHARRIESSTKGIRIRELSRRQPLSSGRLFRLARRACRSVLGMAPACDRLRRRSGRRAGVASPLARRFHGCANDDRCLADRRGLSP